MDNYYLNNNFIDDKTSDWWSFTTPPILNNTYTPSLPPLSDEHYTDKETVFRVVAPLADKSRFTVEVKEGHLFIDYDPIEDINEINKAFTKTFELSDNYITDKTTAKYEEGILTITIPKQSKTTVTVE